MRIVRQPHPVPLRIVEVDRPPRPVHHLDPCLRQPRFPVGPLAGRDLQRHQVQPGAAVAPGARLGHAVDALEREEPGLVAAADREPDAPVPSVPLRQPASQHPEAEHLAVEPLAAREIRALDGEMVKGEHDRERRRPGPLREGATPSEPGTGGQAWRSAPMLLSWLVTSPLAGKRLLLLCEDAELSAVLASAVAELGGEAVRTATGQEAVRALEASRPHAAVLDLPVADTGATALLAELVRSGIPAVVVSGIYRGPRASAELRRLGARDLLEKPFPLDALLASLANSLGAAAPPAQVDADDEVTGSAPLQAGAMPADPFLVIDPGAKRPRRELEGLARPLPDAGRVRVTQPDASPAPTGELAFATVPRLLVALHVGQASGALTLTRGPVKKIVAVERGAPVYAASNVAAERFAAICVRRGIVSAERMEELRKAAPDQRTAELLLGAGLITAA